MKNIENISNFLSKEENNYLLINQVSDEIGIFYLHVIKFFSTSSGININLVLIIEYLLVIYHPFWINQLQPIQFF